MKRFSKILSILLSMLMLLSATTVFAGTAATVPVKKTTFCTNGSCGDLQQLLKQCRSGNCHPIGSLCDLKNGSLNDLIKAFGGFCPDGNCNAYTPPVQQTEPVSPAAPAEEQQPADPPAAQPTEAQPSEFRTAYEDEVVSLVNAERAKYGLPALSVNSGAVSIAHLRAKEIVQSFSHTRPDGRTCFTAASDLGISYRTAGENIAYGYASPAQVVSGWMNSDGHRKNILSSSFTGIGVGCYENNGALYWSQFFIG